MVVTVIVVVIIVVAMVAAVALIGAGNNGSSNLPVKTGDYVLYSVSATTSGTTMTGTYNMTFTQVAGTAVTVEYQVALGSNPVQTTYEHFTYDGKSLSSLSGSSSNGTVETSNVLIGQEYINTNYGTKSVQHYHQVYADGTYDDLYQSSGMGMPLRNGLSHKHHDDDLPDRGHEHYLELKLERTGSVRIHRPKISCRPHFFPLLAQQPSPTRLSHWSL